MSRDKDKGQDEKEERERLQECVGFPTQLQTERRKGMPSWGWRKDGVKEDKGIGILGH